MPKKLRAGKFKMKNFLNFCKCKQLIIYIDINVTRSMISMFCEIYNDIDQLKNRLHFNSEVSLVQGQQYYYTNTYRACK